MIFLSQLWSEMSPCRSQDLGLCSMPVALWVLLFTALSLNRNIMHMSVYIYFSICLMKFVNSNHYLQPD